MVDVKFFCLYLLRSEYGVQYVDVKYSYSNEDRIEYIKGSVAELRLDAWLNRNAPYYASR